MPVPATVILGLMLLASTSGAFSPKPSQSYAHHTVIDPEANYHLYWKLEQDVITFEIHVQTTGWVGFGLSRSGNMNGADIVVGWIDSSGKPYFADTHTERSGRPRQDVNQNWWLTYSRESAGITVLRFYRRLTTCDTSGEDLEIADSTHRLIYAYGPSDPSDLSGLAKHASNRRGTLSLRLLIQAEPASPLPTDTWTYDLFNHNVQVPSDHTTYWCSLHKFPNPPSKQHLIRIQPIITPGNERLVHHLLAYRCTGNHSAIDTSGNGYRCEDPNMPEVDCDVIIGAGAIGGTATDLPKHVGFPVGGAEGPEVILLNMHYDNPDQLSTFVDSSGFRFFVTPTLREHDAGILMTGSFSSPQLIVPPAEPNFRVSSFCADHCLSEAMSHSSISSIRVFSAILHSHLLGRKLSARVTRNGREVAVLDKDDFYDFNFQEPHQMSPELEIKPGDTVVTECEMDSTERSGVTYGGLSTYNEMCLTFLSYYPRLPMSECLSSNNDAETLLFFGATGTKRNEDNQAEATGPSSMVGKNLYEISQMQDWSNATLRSEYARHLQTPNRTQFSWCGFTSTDGRFAPERGMNAYTPLPAAATPKHCSLVSQATTATISPLPLLALMTSFWLGVGFMYAQV